MWHVEQHNQALLATIRLQRESTQIGISSEMVENAFRDLHQLISEQARSKWIVNLSVMDSISSLAIAQLIQTVRLVDLEGGKMVLSSAPPFIEQVLQTMRIVKILPLFSNNNEALAYLND